MKKFTLKTQELHDLALVCSGIVNDKSKDLPFDHIVKMQNTADTLFEAVGDFAKRYDSLTDLRRDMLKKAQDKIVVFQDKVLKEQEENGKVDENYKAVVNQFSVDTMKSANRKISEELSDKFTELYDKDGSKEVEVSIADDKLDILIENFEKFAKDLYKSKKAMVDVYEVLTKAKKE